MEIVRSYGCIVNSLTIDDEDEVYCSEDVRTEVAKRLFDKFSDNYRFFEILAENIIYKYGEYIDDMGNVSLALDNGHVFTIVDDDISCDHKPCSSDSTNTKELVNLLKEKFNVNGDLSSLLSDVIEYVYDEYEVSDVCECCGDYVSTYKLVL